MPLALADRFDLFVFDLDGTLIDSCEDIAASLNVALGALGRERLTLETVRSFVGNGARVLLARSLPADDVRLVEKGLAHFLAHYRDHCLDRTQLFPGVRETLEALSARGKALTVLSNKPTAMSRTILEGLGVARLFRRIDGGDAFPEKKPDPAGLLEAMRSAGVSADRALMVGDSAVDVQCARRAGIAAAGALWGFKQDELRRDPPEFLLSGLAELLRHA